MTTSDEERQPVCECDDFRCQIPLGISWDEHDRLTKLGVVLISNACDTRALHADWIVTTFDGFVAVDTNKYRGEAA